MAHCAAGRCLNSGRMVGMPWGILKLLLKSNDAPLLARPDDSQQFTAYSSFSGRVHWTAREAITSLRKKIASPIFFLRRLIDIQQLYIRTNERDHAIFRCEEPRWTPKLVIIGGHISPQSSFKMAWMETWMQYSRLGGPWYGKARSCHIHGPPL